jgi:hypothetical protein
MGLDMYLKAKKFYYDEAEGNAIIKLALPENHPFKKLRSAEVCIEIGYWRKANEIHNWFVNNVQDGEDNCREYYVTSEHIEELLATVREVLDNPKLAENMLPTQGGFFFGSTEYDEYYFSELRHTEEMLANVLSFVRDNPGYHLYYQSSW